MSQTPRDKTFAREVGKRLGMVLDDLVDRPAASVAKELGYKNATVLSRARRGQTSLSAEKLNALARLKLDSGGYISLDWLLTGKGAPTTMRKGSQQVGQPIDHLAKRVSEAPHSAREKIEAFLDVLGHNQPNSKP